MEGKMLKFTTKTYPVHSDSDINRTYQTTLDNRGFGLTCTCPAGENNRPCKHFFRAQVKHTDAFGVARNNLLQTVFKSKREFLLHFTDLACEMGVNAAIREVLDRGLPADDLRRVDHQVGDWRSLIGKV